MLTSLLASIVAAQAAVWPVVPRPSTFNPNAEGGTFDISQVKVVMAPGAAHGAGVAMAADLTRDLGHKVEEAEATIPENTKVMLAIDPNNDEIGEEGYAMVVMPDMLIAAAKTQTGLFYATQTIRQLALLGKPVPCGTLQDVPRFGWRGMMLDVSRHFFTVPEVKHMLDVMAFYKFNTFHWHLVDDGGWRIQIKSHPELTEVGAWRKGDGKWGGALDFVKPDGKQQVYGGFYTQEQIKEVVAYAKSKHITVVPEIEIPAHELAVLDTNPQLRCTPRDDAAKALFGRIERQNTICPAKPGSYKLFEEVLTEVLDLFPSKYIHIGGDEAAKVWWENCKDCDALKKEKGLKDSGEEQSYVIRHFDKWLESKGRHLIGWDEILEGGLAPGAAVMSWRGIDGGIAAAKAKHNVVMSPTSHCYFDYPYSSISTEKAYEFDPVPKALTAEEGKLVLGGQANLWTEWVENYDRAMAMLYPRALAMSEALWSPLEGRSFPGFESRLNQQFAVLGKLKVKYMVPRPTLAYSAAVFYDSQTLPFGNPPMEGAVLRYTSDGQAPTASSPAAPASLKIDKTQRLRLAYFLPDGSKSDEAVVDAVKLTGPRATALTQATFQKRVLMGTFNACPKESAFASSPMTTAKSIGIEGMPEDKPYALDFKGWFLAETDGDYTFALTSDDGSMLWLAGAQVVDNDGPHGAATQRGRVRLQKGVYPLQVRYFESGGAHSLSLEVTGPDGKTRKL